jgi:hypothetical protein
MRNYYLSQKLKLIRNSEFNHLNHLYVVGKKEEASGAVWKLV